MRVKTSAIAGDADAKIEFNRLFQCKVRFRSDKNDSDLCSFQKNC